MTTNYERYTGEKALKMDPKYRVSIQSSWRPESGVSLYLQHGENHGMGFIKVLTREAYVERVERIQASDKSVADKARLLKMLASSCRDASINDQGKLLVPKEVSEKAGIAAESDVMLVGCGMHFEIWNKTNYEKVQEIEAASLAELDDLGIFN